MKLSELLAGSEYNCTGGDPENIDINDIIYDSRQDSAGKLFVCLVGSRRDGHIYATGVYERGCRAFLCQNKLDLPEDAVQIICNDTRIALAELSAVFFGHPEKRIKIIGITGTKGKTTVASLIADVLNKAGIKAGYIGTNGINIDGMMRPTVNSTPESYVLFKTFNEMADCGVKYAVIEVSSQAYLMHRVHGIKFEIGVFTNLSPDHIGAGEHPDFENYRDCKAKLFENSKYSVFNADDEYYTFMARHAASMTRTYAVEAQADYKAESAELLRDRDSLGVAFKCRCDGDVCDFSLRIPGMYSVYNGLAVIAVTRMVGVNIKAISETLSGATVKGRFELVRVLPDVTFIIDYAHNDLSLRSVLGTIRKYSPKRLVCVFGSVGGKSVMRREELGRAAGELCDYCIITSDNPDYEDPMEIAQGIEAGIADTGCRYKIICDRTQAVKTAVEGALAGDVILFAGKGHENYQIVNGEYVPFSERSIIEETASQLQPSKI